MDKSQWTANIQSIYGAATRNLVYGCWRVERVENAILFDGEVWRHEKQGWKVSDVRGNVIAVVASEEAARLIALLPDLCDIDLRGTGTGRIRGEFDCVEDKHREIRIVGIPDPQEAYELGFHEAWNDGIHEGYEIARREFEDADTDSVEVEERGPHGCLTVGWRGDSEKS